MKTHWHLEKAEKWLCHRKEKQHHSIKGGLVDFPEVKSELVSNMMKVSSSLMNQFFFTNLSIYFTLLKYICV
jgi:hypothetical protein